MMTLLEQMNFWHWIALGLVLLLLELLGAAGYLLWLGISAVLVGLLMIALPLSWTLQWVAFAVFSLFTTWLWWRYQHQRDIQNDKTNTLNQRGAQMIGQECVLDHAIVAGNDRMRLGDTTWSIISSRDLPAGTRVKIVSINGIVLTVTEKK